MSGSRIFLATLQRDLRLEFRTREALNAMFFYALLVIVIFSFAFSADTTIIGQIGGGLLWVAFLFAGMVALDRAFLREMMEGSLTGIQIAPASPSAVMAGKFASSFLLMLAMEAILLPLFAVLFNAPAKTNWAGIAGVTVMGTWALAANGTYFSAMSTHARQRSLLLPLLLLPVSIPAVIAMVQATQSYLSGSGDTGYWWKLLTGYDIIFTALGWLLADVVIDVE